MTTTESPISQAVERAGPPSPREMVKQYEASFAAVLPSHITKPETWVRIAQGALKKGKRLPSGKYELEQAAENNPAGFLATLLDCARLGLEPGTEQYYLTPREVKGRTEILGIVGYQGIVELMYRAGAVSSVVVEVVRANDHFEYSPGRHERPIHDIDWDSEDRGDLRLVYAYGVMKDGATSKVVVLNKASIDRIKAKATGAGSKYSPWQSDTEAMWLKSAARQLRKWVPTSSEYIRERLRIAGEFAPETTNGNGHDPVPDTAYRTETDIIDAEVVEPDDEPESEHAPGEEPFDPEPGEDGWDG